jgi:excisionase family DNA binding protein
MHGPNRDVPEAAWYLGISRAQLYKLIAAGELTPVHIGRRTLVATGELDRYIQARMAEAQHQPVGAH